MWAALARWKLGRDKGGRRLRRCGGVAVVVVRGEGETGMVVDGVRRLVRRVRVASP